MESVTAFLLGLVAFYERTVGIYAALNGINAYHRPGVDAGKKAAHAVLDVQNEILETMSRDDSAQTVGQLTKAAGTVVELVYDILSWFALLKRFGVRQVQLGHSPAACVLVRN